MAYLLADAKVTILRRLCSAGMKNVISRFARGGKRGELSNRERGNEEVYDLQGRHVKPSKKGFYIKDGKTVVIK